MTATAEPRAGRQVELVIGGMTCASCANRVERSLNKIDGVSATVNYATEKAAVRAPDGIDPARLVAAVEAAGYTATLPAPATGTEHAGPSRTRPVRCASGCSGRRCSRCR